MNDVELVAELREVYAEAAAGLRASPDLARRVRTRERRRRSRWVLAGATPLIAAAVALILVVRAGPGGSSPARPAARSAVHGVPGLRTAYVARRIRASLAAGSGGYVVEDVTAADPHARTGLLRHWFDPGSGSSWGIQYDLAGRPISAQGLRGLPVHDGYERQVTREVDYRDRTWTRQTQTVGPIGRTTGLSRTPINLASSSAEVLRDLHAGRLRVLRRGTIVGQAAIEIALGRRATGFRRMWIYADTFHPLRVTFAPGSTGTWYPRTAADAAAADPRIPHGFRYVSPAAFR